MNGYTGPAGRAGEDGRGMFITLEGIDGCGKTTQAAHLAGWLGPRTGRPVLRTFEPGGWDGGASLRALILGGDVRDARTELLLFLADRSGHVAGTLLPALGVGKLVLCERYSDSTRAYQVAGRGLPAAMVEALLDGCGFPRPDLTVLLEISPEAAAGRLAARGGGDRIEGGGIAFMARVAEGYAELARSEPERFLTVPAEGTEEEVAQRVRRGVSAWLEAPR